MGAHLSKGLISKEKFTTNAKHLVVILFIQRFIFFKIHTFYYITTILSPIYTTSKPAEKRMQIYKRKNKFKNRKGRVMTIEQKTSATGFEPVRVTPADFESVSLTARTY